MQKQMYPIMKTDWCVTVRTKKNGVKRIRFYYGTSLKEVKGWAAKRKGEVQFFKLSYEFKSAKVQA